MSRTGNEPKFIEFLTPIGRVVFESLAEPQQDTDGNPPKPKFDPETGAPIMHYKVTLMWPKAELDTSLIPLRTLAAQARDLKWPVGSYDPNFFHVQPFLRDGDNPEHNTKGKEELRGHVYLSIKSKAKMVRNPADPTKWIPQGGQPGIIGPNREDLLPVDVYSGSFARASGIMFGTEYSGKRYISVRLNNVQKAWDGERLGGGGRPDAKSQFDALAGIAPPPGATPVNTAVPGFGAPGGGLPSML
jgi:hypothetical protein